MWAHPQDEGLSPDLWEADGHRKHPLFQASPCFSASEGERGRLWSAVMGNKAAVVWALLFSVGGGGISSCFSESVAKNLDLINEM